MNDALQHPQKLGILFTFVILNILFWNKNLQIFTYSVCSFHLSKNMYITCENLQQCSYLIRLLLKITQEIQTIFISKKKSKAKCECTHETGQGDNGLSLTFYTCPYKIKIKKCIRRLIGNIHLRIIQVLCNPKKAHLI